MFWLSTVWSGLRGISGRGHSSVAGCDESQGGLSGRLTEDFDSLPSSVVALVNSTRCAGITIHIAVGKRNPAERLVSKYVSRRGFPVLAKIKPRRRNDESMPPTIQNGSSDISLGVKTRAREHLHKLFSHLPLNLAVGEWKSTRIDPSCTALQRAIPGSGTGHRG